MAEQHFAEMDVISILNDLRARELAVIAQYMRHHYMVTGADGVALAGEFKEIAITEMKHAEALAERIDFLGGDPTTKPEPIETGAQTLEQMARADFAREQDAVRRYRSAIRACEQSGDVTTRKMLEDILGDEEEHAKTFSDMFGGAPTEDLVHDLEMAGAR